MLAAFREDGVRLGYLCFYERVRLARVDGPPVNVPLDINRMRIVGKTHRVKQAAKARLTLTIATKPL